MLEQWPNHPLIAKALTRRLWRRLFSTLGPRYITKDLNDIKLKLDISDLQGVSKMILKHGNYEEYMISLAQKWVRPGSQVIDVGANIGFWSISLSQMTEANVYAFEPEPHNLELLKNNIAINHIQNVVVIDKACGEKTDQLKLYLSKMNHGDHQLYNNTIRKDFVNVPVTRVDDELQNISNVSFIKIDIQGYEYFAVKGMEKILTTNNDIKILSEFWPEGMQRAGTSSDDYLNYFKSLGFGFQLVDTANRQLKAASISELQDLCSNNRQADLVFSKQS